MQSEFTFRSTNLPNKCFQHFASFKRQKKFCDVTFTVGMQNISAHRMVLAAAIPFFEERLTESDEIVMPDIDPVIFQYLIDFAYTCTLQITMENVRDLLSSACQLQMNEVRDACSAFLAERLCPENSLSFRELAVELHYPQLTKITDDYIKEHFTEIYQTERFSSCPFSYVRDLTGKEDLYVDSEEKVLEAVLKWVKASPDDRKVNLPDLLRLVRMPLMTPLYLTEVVEREELIRTSTVSRDLVDEAKNYNHFPQKRTSVCSFSTEPRQFAKANFSCSHNDRASIWKLTATGKYKAQYFDITQNAWLTKEKQSFIIHNGCSAALNNKIYFFNDGCTLVYNPANNEYEYLRNPSTARNFSGAASLKNKIYVCGGTTDEKIALSVVECFHPATNCWTEIKPMHIARFGFAAVALGDFIFVLGGRDYLCVHNSVERYPSVTGGWTTMAPMLTKRSYHGSCALNGKIYACGGRAPVSSSWCVASAEVYDPITNKWVFIAPMHRARREFALISYRGELYSIGGMGKNRQQLYPCEIYDPEDDKWTFGQRLDPEYYASAVVVT